VLLGKNSMSVISKTIKIIIQKFLSLKFLERITHVVIWKKILDEKKPKITASIYGPIKENMWDISVRQKTWDKIPDHLDVDKEILYLEFGTWTGRSIKYFANKYRNKNSEFYGFDTFTGMPSKWRWLDQGHYDTSGNPPKVDDNRIKFVKGLFQDTLPEFLKKLESKSKEKIVVINFDAVLYSATLFTLFELDKYFKNYYFIFDQFGTDECRAFHNYTESKIIKYDLLLACKYESAPEVVFGKFKNK
jgi:O-methyltransferase